VSGRTLRPLADADAGLVREFTAERWGAPVAVSSGRMHQLDRLPGFAVFEDGRLRGLATYLIEGDACELVSIDAVDEGQGIGSELLEAVCATAAGAGCSLVHLITTNDNLRALRFYQRRGFRLTEVRPGAIAGSRALKPSIPEVGCHGIPLRDELVLERDLRGA
jgi:GNAT superfamily N-acetyltransferase